MKVSQLRNLTQIDKHNDGMKRCINSYENKHELSSHGISLNDTLCWPKSLKLDQSPKDTRNDRIITKYRLCACRKRWWKPTLNSSEQPSKAKTTHHKEFFIAKNHYTYRQTSANVFNTLETRQNGRVSQFATAAFPMKFHSCNEDPAFQGRWLTNIAGDPRVAMHHKNEAAVTEFYCKM